MVNFYRYFHWSVIQLLDWSLYIRICWLLPDSETCVQTDIYFTRGYHPQNYHLYSFHLPNSSYSRWTICDYSCWFGWYTFTLIPIHSIQFYSRVVDYSMTDLYSSYYYFLIIHSIPRWNPLTIRGPYYRPVDSLRYQISTTDSGLCTYYPILQFLGGLLPHLMEAFPLIHSLHSQVYSILRFDIHDYFDCDYSTITIRFQLCYSIQIQIDCPLFSFNGMDPVRSPIHSNIPFPIRFYRFLTAFPFSSRFRLGDSHSPFATGWVFPTGVPIRWLCIRGNPYHSGHGFVITPWQIPFRIFYHDHLSF